MIAIWPAFSGPRWQTIPLPSTGKHALYRHTVDACCWPARPPFVEPTDIQSVARTRRLDRRSIGASLTSTTPSTSTTLFTRNLTAQPQPLDRRYTTNRYITVASFNTLTIHYLAAVPAKISMLHKCIDAIISCRIFWPVCTCKCIYLRVRYTSVADVVRPSVRCNISKTTQDRPIVIMEHYTEAGTADSVAAFRSHNCIDALWGTACFNFQMKICSNINLIRHWR